MTEHAVLFVDDEVNILKAIQRLLRNEPMRVLTATDPAEALEIMRKTPPQVVVTDQRMPTMSGVEFLSAVREQHSDTIRMMLTGYTEMAIAVDAINQGEIYRLITKPWNDDELRATLRQAFDHYDLKSEIKRLNTVSREQNFKLQDMNRNLELKVRDRTKQLALKNQELSTAYIQTIRALAEAIPASAVSGDAVSGDGAGDEEQAIEEKRAALGKQAKAASLRARLLQHESLTNWVLAQRTLLHLSQILEIVATGGVEKPTYAKGQTATSTGAATGAIVDRAA